ncbi:MAG: hypothetical protein ACL93V_07070 [Candidatus Electrothrix sp. YB6]
MDKERYRRGSHTVADFKYHFVWKTKYGHHVLQDDIALRLFPRLRKTYWGRHLWSRGYFGAKQWVR